MVAVRVRSHSITWQERGVLFWFFSFSPGCQIASLCFNGMIIIVSYAVHPKLSPAAPSTDWQTHGNLTNLFWPPLNQVVCEIIWLCIFPLGKLKNWWRGPPTHTHTHTLHLLLLLHLLRLQTAPLQYPAACPRVVFILLTGRSHNCALASQSGAAAIALGSICSCLWCLDTLCDLSSSQPPQVTLWYHWENRGLNTQWASNALVWSISSTTGDLTRRDKLNSVEMTMTTIISRAPSWKYSLRVGTGSLKTLKLAPCLEVPLFQTETRLKAQAHTS